jgi:hypothetical protein
VKKSSITQEMTAGCRPACTLARVNSVGFIAEMLGVPPNEIAWLTNPETTIEYESQVQFQNALLAFVGESAEDVPRHGPSAASPQLVDCVGGATIFAITRATFS